MQTILSLSLCRSSLGRARSGNSKSIAAIASHLRFSSNNRNSGKRNNNNQDKESKKSSSNSDQIFELIDSSTTDSSLTIIKKSKFNAIIGYATDIESAMQFISTVRDDNATHNCWAFKSPSYERYSDDKEVAGTAGKPILLAINSVKLVNCVVVVIRNYGGINLGRGGLFRAYFNAAKQVISKVDLKKLPNDEPSS